LGSGGVGGFVGGFCEGFVFCGDFLNPVR